MNRIQKWFDQMALFSRQDHHRYALAQQVFGTQRLDTSALQKPACWRRKPSSCAPRR